MKKLSLLTLSVIVINFSSVAQLAIKQHVQENTVAVRSIRMEDTSDADLTLFGNAIGDARIVMLGEQDHGDAPTFEAKTRLVKYLHEKKGFEVIAFESDFYGLSQGWNKVQNGELTLKKLMEQNISPVWIRCHQCTDVFDYIQSRYNTPKPLILTGFDNQLVMHYSQQNFKKQLDAFLVGLQLPFTSSLSYREEFLPLVDSVLDPYRQRRMIQDERSLQRAIAQADTILSQLKSKRLQQDFWYMALESFKALCQQIQNGRQNYSAANQARDQQMAANLAWLAQVKYPGKKIIVWAASYHIIKDKLEHLRHLTMGYYFTQQPKLAKQTYVLGFTSYAGSAGAVHIKPYEFSSSQKESLEDWLHEKQHDFAFVDFKAFRKNNPRYNEPFFMGGVRHLQQQADWTKSFDGVFYIRHMYPCSTKPQGN